MYELNRFASFVLQRIFKFTFSSVVTIRGHTARDFKSQTSPGFALLLLLQS